MILFTILFSIGDLYTLKVSWWKEEQEVLYHSVEMYWIREQLCNVSESSSVMFLMSSVMFLMSSVMF
jgi:hypothetical protein